MIRKNYLLLFLLLSGITVIAKTTYIPKYRSYIHIVNGSDTISTTNNLLDLRLDEDNNMFCIYIEHEDVTKEKVKAIKRAKRAAGWATFSAVMSGISTVYSQNSLQYLVRSTNTRIVSQLADIYSENANTEENLLIDMWITNTSVGEIMINEIERGLIWYVRPSQSLHLHLNNPDVANLRISDIHNNNVRYAMIAAGSTLIKKAIEWEDDECWISAIMKNIDYEYPVLDKYVRISKDDYTETEMSIEQFKDYMKEAKKNR